MTPGNKSEESRWENGRQEEKEKARQPRGQPRARLAVNPKKSKFLLAFQHKIPGTAIPAETPENKDLNKFKKPDRDVFH